MKVSIIICTYNRAPILGDTIESYRTLLKPEQTTIDLLVVDNNSNDGTAALVEKFRRSVPELRYLKEPKQGLSYARNTGILACHDSDIIAFVDDDVYFDSHWLVEMHRAFVNTPEAGCVGGQSIPLFEAGTPAWISPSLLNIYGATNSGDRFKRMVYPEHPFGLNMAFRNHVFTAIGAFNPTLGRKKTNLMSNEETELFYRIHHGGIEVFYTPDAKLQHRIPTGRTQPSWVLDRYYWQGASDIAFEQIIAPTKRREMLRRAAYILLHDLRQLLRQRIARVKDPAHEFLLKAKSRYQVGAIVHLLQSALRPESGAVVPREKTSGAVGKQSLHD